MIWNDNKTITVTPPAKPKKITGTRFAAILGANVWSSPFNAWCAITRTYEEPFTDTIYTIAGKTIEPKQADYMEKQYFWRNLKRPADVWGEDFFQKTYGDFFPYEKIFGGMWDYLFTNEEGNQVEAVLEMKTTKRAEDWEEDIPEYYALQAAFYAWLLEVDEVIMVCTILTDKDYEHPEDVIVNEENTFERRFRVSERYPHFGKYIDMAENWWKNHVLTGNSPAWDEKRDADILKELRKNNVNPDTQLTELIAEAEELQEKLDKVAADTAKDKKRLDQLKDMIKTVQVGMFRDGDKQVLTPGRKYDWTVSRTVSLKIDEDALQADGLLDKYKTKETVTYRLTTKAKGGK